MLKLLTKISPVKLLQYTENFLLSDYNRTKKFLTSVNPEALEEISKKKALAIFKNTVKSTPAYQKFLSKNKTNIKLIKNIKYFDLFVPETDKDNYIKKYPLEHRCQYGKLPKTGNVDESGGTSGIATNWIHDIHEEDPLFKGISFEFNYAFEGYKKDFFVISAWSVGPWATGIKFSALMEKLALVKNTATDPDDVVRTLKMFGNKKNYLIGGYPPFVKNLIEENSKKIKWKNYKIDLVIGGEGVTVEWVKYMKKKLRPGSKIVSSYGASDIDIGVGFETPFCFFIRELISKNKTFRNQLIGKEEVPMIFQYNPTLHYIKNKVSSKGKGEFQITLLDDNTVSPKVKYNIHDEGKKLTFNEMMGELNTNLKNPLNKFKTSGGKIEDILNLPFLLIFGRTDGTLSFDGANVFPLQIEKGILRNKELVKKTKRFKIEKKHDKKHNVQFHVHIELKENHKTHPKLKTKYYNNILNELLESNPDFKESYSKNKKLKPIINIYKYSHPLFEIDKHKVKNIYIVKKGK
jgi:phenylacetate-CoA ligase